MLADVFLGIEGGFRCKKAGSLAHVGIEMRHGAPSAGKGELHVSAMYWRCIS